MERVVLAFVRAGRVVREGLMTATAEAAVEVGEWREACGEARRRVAERMARVEEAKAGVVRALGAGSAEELAVELVVVAAEVRMNQRQCTKCDHRVCVCVCVCARAGVCVGGCGSVRAFVCVCSRTLG